MLLCAQANKHVFVEKPFTMSTESAKRAASTLTKAGLVCALGHNRRFLPAMIRLHEIVSSGKIGQLLHVEANISAPSGGRHPNGHWRNNPSECPVGGMTALGIHMTDALISLVGPIAEVRTISEQRVLRGSVDDVTYLTMRFSDGSTYTSEFKNDEFNGQGTFTSFDGSIYVGTSRNGKPHGKGVMAVGEIGVEYSGDFAEGQFHGG